MDSRPYTKILPIQDSLGICMNCHLYGINAPHKFEGLKEKSLVGGGVVAVQMLPR